MEDNFGFDENDGKFSKRAENTVGKGEITYFAQFLLLPQCFQKTCAAVSENKDMIGKGQLFTV